jgi:hypothetical protein
VNRNRPPGFNAIATRRTSSRCAPAESRNIRPTATIPSNVRPNKDESSTGSHAASARGKRLRNSAIKLGDASIPRTVHPSFISAAEIGTPCPQPRSSTDAPAGSDLAHSRTVTTPIVDRSRPAISSAATASYPFDLSPDSVRFMSSPGIRSTPARREYHLAKGMRQSLNTSPSPVPRCSPRRNDDEGLCIDDDFVARFHGFRTRRNVCEKSIAMFSRRISWMSARVRKRPRQAIGHVAGAHRSRASAGGGADSLEPGCQVAPFHTGNVGHPSTRDKVSRRQEHRFPR